MITARIIFNQASQDIQGIPMKSFKKGKDFRIFGCVPWSSVISLVIKPSYSNQGVMECIKDWSNSSEVFIWYFCVGTQINVLFKQMFGCESYSTSVIGKMDYFKALTWLMHPKMGPTGEGYYWWSFTRKGLHIWRNSKLCTNPRLHKKMRYSRYCSVLFFCVS